MNNIHEKRVSKQHTVKVKHFPDATKETIFEKMVDLLESQPDVLILHAGTNHLPKNLNPLNNLRKVHWKCLQLSPESKLVFSNIIIRKDKPNLDKHRKGANARMKNFCNQKDIGLIDNRNLQGHHLDTKKLPLNNKGNSAFAKVESWIADVDIFDEIRVRHILKDNPRQSYPIWKILVRLRIWLILGSAIKKISYYTYKH